MGNVRSKQPGVVSRLRFLAVVLVFHGMVPVSPPLAAEVSAPISIVVGSELDYPPYALVTEDGKADGFSVDLFKAVCEAMNIVPSFRVGPWNEVRTALERGEVDALPLVSYSKERDRVFDFSVPHAISHGVVFKRNGDPGIDSVSDLRDKEIIVMRSDAAHDWLIRNDISENLVMTGTVAESLKLLAEGEHDYAVSPRLVGLLTARQLDLGNIEVTGPLLDAYGRGYGFAVKEGNFALLARLNEGLSIVRATGRYDQISEKWFGVVDPKGVPAAVLLRYAALGVGGVVIVAAMVLAWIVTLRRTVRRQTVDLQAARDHLEARVEARTRDLRREIAERKAIERQLAQAQKMEAVGQLTGGLAHDLNNALAIISINMGMIERSSEDREPFSTFVAEVMKGVDRASNLTRKLLDYSRTEVDETRRVRVNDFVFEMESLIAKSLTPAIALELSLSETTWTVEIDPGDFETALLNLALNARDAMPDGGTMFIEAENKIIDQTYVNLNPESTAGDFVMISISDNGSGMPPEVIEGAFDPFFTTKEVGKGTGLGLSMVYGFVRRSGGHVKIYSEPGEGTSIRMYLPRAAGEADKRPGCRVNADGLPGGHETILVVDDEENLVTAAVTILESLGYRTISAASGKQALDILDGNPSIDLLFSDVIMPRGMDGYRLAIEALNRRPGLRVLLTSGFTSRREEFVNGENRIASDLAKSLLHKPYNIAELAVAIRNALDGRG
ncbi:MAG: transporter substrate-binding domain-containing protein [Rhodospirillales bacterium]|nr:transporter substrate-binding domain-containing protein [Rhodospirillales bacterium]